MGGSSKAQIVGYKYSLGEHLVWFYGQADKLLRVRVDKRTAWEGSADPGQIYIDKPKLFGGEKKEGGVQGYVDFEDGNPAQAKNDYLMARLGALIPAFRGVTAFVLRRVYLGLNPYLKPWEARFQRIHKTYRGATQWYDDTAEIPSGEAGALVETPIDDFSQGLAPYTATPAGHFENFEIVTSPAVAMQVTSGTDGFDSVVRPIGPALPVALRFKFRVISTGSNDPARVAILNAGNDYVLVLDPMRQESVDPLRRCQIIIPRLDGSAINMSAGQLEFGEWYDLRVVLDAAAYTITCTLKFGSTVIGSHVWAGSALSWTLPELTMTQLFFRSDTDTGSGIGQVQFGSLFWTNATAPGCDMNPAHMIREVVTTPKVGLGRDPGEVDDDAYTYAADTLYAEGFGLSILWERQSTCEEFIKEICRHIDAQVYADRSTGKHVLYLIRDDYDFDDLLILDESNIEEIQSLPRPEPGDLINTVTAVYHNRPTAKDSAVKADDLAAIQMQGGVIPTTVQYPMICRSDLASRVVLRDLKALGYPLLSVTLTANRAATGLNLGHPFRLQWPDLGVGDVVMRVTEIGFGDGRDNRVSITAVQDVFALPDQAFVAVEEGAWEDPNSEPAPAPNRLVEEAPYLEIVRRMGQSATNAALADAPEAGYLLVAAQRPSDDATNAEFDVDSGAGYAEGGTLAFAPVAELAAGIGKMDTEIEVINGADLESLKIGSLAQIGGELVRIDAIGEETTSGILITIGRACLDTVPADHVASELIWGIETYGDSDEVQYVMGETIDVKVLPITGLGELDVAEAPADSVTMNERAIRPYSPGNVRFSGSISPAASYYPTWVFGALTIDAAHRDRLLQTSGNLADFLAGGIGPESGTTYTIEIYETSTLVESASGITAFPWTSALIGTRTVDVVLYAVRDGYESWQSHMHTLTIYNGGDYMLEEDGGMILDESGAPIEEEA